MKMTSQPLIQRTFAIIFALGLVLAEALHAATPTLSNVMPRGGQRGSTIAVAITGTYLSDVEEIFFHTKGIRAEKITPEKDRLIKAILAIAPDAKLGQHEMRVRTASGVSTMKTFWVGPFPNVTEAEPNSEFDKAQKVPMNSTVNGRITNEDVDYYEIEVKKGQQISAEVEAIRLSGALFDPYVAILDARRFELAACDDSALLLQDSVASVIAPEDGTYRIEIRDSSYRGSGNHFYRLHLGHFPRPLIAFPAGGEKGEKLEVTLMGDPAGPIKKTLQLPDQADPDFGYVSERNGTSAPSPNRIRVSDFPSIREVEPNNNWKQATATELNLPLAFDGIIAEDGDIDYFKFKAKKGQRFNVRAHARSVSSPLDPVLNIRDAAGKSLKGNDDANNGPDSLITSFTFPADGEYIFSIYDHLRKGGPQHIYRIETEAFEAEVVASIPYLRQRDSQSRQMMPVPRGNRIATIMNVTRRNFSGDLEFLAKGLPAGIRMHAPKATSNLTQVPIVFEAEENAPLASSLVDLRVRHVDPESKIEGGFRQQLDLVYGPPNNRTYFGSTLDRLAVAVTEKAPYSIELIKPATPIMQTGSMSLQVKIIRDANYTEPINVRLLTRPPGIGAGSSVTIPAGKTEANYPITANGGAAVGTWQIAMLGAAKTKHGEIIVSSRLVNLEIEPPYLSLKINMSAIERGKEGEIICDVEQKRPFSGEAVVTLHGLPAKVSSTAQKIDANSTQLVFPIKTEPTARAGLSRNLFCFVKVPLGENVLNHSLASGGQLRMDNPPPTPKKPVAKKTKPTVVAAKPKPKAAKPLSRLEKLRLAAKEAAGGTN